MHSQASKILKQEMQKLKAKYHLDYIQNNNIDLSFVNDKLQTIEETIQEKIQDEIYCPETSILLKQRIDNRSTYDTLETCGLCHVCKSYYHHSFFDKLTHSGWPVSYYGKGIICKNCNKI